MELSILNHPDFGTVRTYVDAEEKVLFCARDVAMALGYKNPNDAILRHCIGRIGKIDTPTSSGIQNIAYITEPDVYRLITKSKLPLASTFELWIYDNILPTLRTKGYYAKKELLNDPDFFIELGLKMKREQEEILGLQQEVEELNGVIAEYEPKLSYLDQIINSDNCLNVTNIAADYGISAIKLNRILFSERIQRKQGTQWVLYAKYAKGGYTTSETVPIRNGTKSVTTTKWTQKGRLLIHEVMTNRGFLPESEK